MKAHPRNRRRQFYLPNTSQPQLMLGAISFLGGVALLIALVFLAISNRDLTKSYYLAHLAIENLQQLLLPTLIIVNLIGSICSILFLLFFTHRIAGPIFRMRAIFKEIARGNLTGKVHFRKNDYLKEMEDDANLALEFLRTELREMDTTICSLAEVLAASSGNQAPDAILLLNRLFLHIQKFQLPLGKEEVNG